MKKSQSTSAPSENEYIGKMKEWQEHQYDPGYYTGGNMPPILTHTGRPKLLGWFWIISSIVPTLILTALLVLIIDKEDLVNALIIVIPIYALVVLQVIGGIRLIKRGKKESYSRYKKVLLNICSYIAVLSIVFFVVNSAFLVKEGSLIINHMDLVQFLHEDNKNYLIINNKTLILECNEAFYSELWESRVKDQGDGFIIEYKWNVLNPERGKVLNIELKR